MNARIHHLLDEMLALEPSERSALLLALLDSHEDDEPSDEVQEAWRQMAQKRLASLDRGETVAVPWEEVKARFLAL
jgi:putative addiction module component (TIGR02574 family)